MSDRLAGRDRSALLDHLGRRVAHVNAAANLPGIATHGLMPAAELARLSGRAPADIALRPERTALRYGASGHTARLNHQKPILHGLAAANRGVEGHDAASWAEVLDARVFFWPERHLRGPFLASVQRDLETAVIWLDTEAMLDRAGDRLDLSPINSGNFTQGGAHARRGNWLFVPARAGLEAFRRNRQARGLVRAPDAVKEISLRGALSANDLAASRVDSETDGQGAQ